MTTIASIKFLTTRRALNMDKVGRNGNQRSHVKGKGGENTSNHLNQKGEYAKSEYVGGRSGN